MTTHEPTVHRIQDDPAAWPTYRIEWPNGEPNPGDLVLMSVDLFKQSIEILSGICHACLTRQQDPAVTVVVNCAKCGNPDYVHGSTPGRCQFVSPS